MERFATILLDWYATHKRDLPWRGTSDPYRIWISEIILQQTRVAQGRAYYERFVARFPDVKSLAAASEDEVLRHWQGLGYYSRARNLHAAAKSVAEGFPNTYEEVRALKGVGEYTAAAICSIAYDLPYAVVDGNVYRVLARYMGMDVPIDSATGKKDFAKLARAMMPEECPGLYNQAIMDFGAMQCTPSAPNCLSCPLADSCVALGAGRVAELPVKQGRTKVRDRFFTYIYVRAGAYTFIHKRAGKDIWEGLYELPLIETPIPLGSLDELVDRPEWKRWLGGSVPTDVRMKFQGVKHVLSHQVIRADFYEVCLPEDAAAWGGFQKIAHADLVRYAFPRLVHAFLLQEGALQE